MIIFNQPFLIIGDSSDDYNIMVDVFAKAGLSNSIVHCENGDGALNYLFRCGIYLKPVKSPRPGIIFLDLNISVKDALKVLKAIKRDEDLKKIPVIILSASSNEADIEICYKGGANSCLPKPINFEGFLKSIQNLPDHSLEIVVLPKAG